jgi:excisionase family DNA binding protein
MGLNLLTAKEVAKQLNLSASTITEWGRSGKIPRVKISHKIIRYPLDAVQAALVKQAAVVRKATILGGGTCV